MASEASEASESVFRPMLLATCVVRDRSERRGQDTREASWLVDRGSSCDGPRVICSRDVLGPGSPLSRAPAASEHREGQLALAETVQPPLGRAHHLFVAD